MLISHFVYEQNLRHLRAILARTSDEEERKRIVALIDEEDAKWAGETHARAIPH